LMFRPPSLLSPQIVPTAAILLQGSRGFYVRAYRALLPPHAPDMLTVRIQVIDGTGTFTLSDSQPCRLLTFLRRHYPASSVLRAHPTPHRARSDLHRPPVDLSLDRAMGSPVLPQFSLCTCRRHYPGGAAGCLSLSSPAVAAFPVSSPGQPPHHRFRGLLDVYSHYSPHTRGVA
jgi:hypothetical protein